MTTLTLIKKLQNSFAANGDLPVYIYDSEFCCHKPLNYLVAEKVGLGEEYTKIDGPILVLSKDEFE